MMLDDHDAPLKLLSEVFGHAEFRDGQRDIVDAVIAGENTLNLPNPPFGSTPPPLANYPPCVRFYATWPT